MTNTTAATSSRGAGIAMPEAPARTQFLLDRWEVLQLIKDTAAATGLREREIAVLAAHLSVLPKGPVRSDRPLISFAEVAGILERANCMDERRFRRGEARLEAQGFVARRLSANGRRFPVRDGTGRLVDGYGIDLRPLFDRVPELRATRDALAEEAARRNAVRSRISARVSDLKRQALATLGHVPEALQDAALRIRTILRRKTATPEEMTQAEHILAGLEEAPQPRPIEPAAAPVPDRQADDRGQIVRRSESTEKENTMEGPQGEPAETLSDAWRECPNITGFYPDPPRSQRHLAGCLMEFSGFLGLGQRTRETALRTLGLANFLRVLDYMAGRIHKLGRPDGYLARMVREFSEGHAIAGGRVVSRGRSFGMGKGGLPSHRAAL